MSEPAPVLRVVRGDATPEEIAALLTVLQAVATTAPAEPSGPSEWSSPRRAARAPLAPSRDGWRTSAFPG